MTTKLKAGTATSGAVLDADTTGILELQTGSTPTTAIIVDANQNVGVGTASPQSRFHVASSSAESVLGRLQSTGSTASYMGFGGSGATNLYDVACGAAGTNIFAIRTSDTERMRIGSNGAVAIGTTDTTTGAPKISVSGGTNTYNLIVATDTDTTYSTSNRYAVFYNSTNGLAGSIQHTAVTTVAYSTSSDERLKENIVAAPTALEKVVNLPVRSYDWKNDNTHVEYGFVAQELAKVYGEPVGAGGDDVNENPWNIEYGRLTPILVKAIQEQQTMIEELKTKVAALEAK